VANGRWVVAAAAISEERGASRAAALAVTWATRWRAALSARRHALRVKQRLRVPAINICVFLLSRSSRALAGVAYRRLL